MARFSDHPPRAKGIPQVGDAARVDFERVFALKPDLVLAWRSGNQAGDIERLEQFGYSVFVTEPARLPDIPRLLRRIGLLAGSAAAAEHAAADFEQEILALRGRFALRSRVRVFYEIWHQPLITINGTHIISDVIRLCGGENVFAGAALLTPTVSFEAVAAARPDVVVGGTTPGDAQEFAQRWRSSPLAALRAIPALYVNPDHLQRPTLRILEGARAVCAHLEGIRGNRQRAR